MKKTKPAKGAMAWVVLSALIILLLELKNSSIEQENCISDDEWAACQPREVPSLQMSKTDVHTLLKGRLKYLSPKTLEEFTDHIWEICRENQFRPSFILSLIQVESSFRVSAVSSAGAIGLMQLMPETADWIAQSKRIRYEGTHQLTDPFINVSLGVNYLAFLRDRYQGRPIFFLTAYNAGPSELERLLKFNRKISKWHTRKYLQAIYEEIAIIQGLPQGLQKTSAAYGKSS